MTEDNPNAPIENYQVSKFDDVVLTHRMTPEQYKKYSDACDAEAAKGGTLGQILTAGYNVLKSILK